MIRTPLGSASRLDQDEAEWRNAVLEQPFPFAEHQRKDPHAILVDEFCSTLCEVGVAVRTEAEPELLSTAIRRGLESTSPAARRGTSS